ncbi:Hypothetical_protein [Hexamita inflata]|uniref:Hypothetical_protein n=1 Tax=Hexamita inflata TaxID=28002 RepID=A0AA86PPU1_9EUKA|nr:Hypothetical protein HINF_LOCUS31594 [Hexamita inflata]
MTKKVRSVQHLSFVVLLMVFFIVNVLLVDTAIQESYIDLLSQTSRHGGDQCRLVTRTSKICKKQYIVLIFDNSRKFSGSISSPAIQSINQGTFAIIQVTHIQTNMDPHERQIMALDETTAKPPASKCST